MSVAIRGAAERWAVPLSLMLAVAVLASVIGFTPLHSLDYWWHLRTGELIAETGSVPKVDSYTYTVPGARWIDLHWTFQLGLNALYQMGGHSAVRIAKGACILALAAILGAAGWRRSRIAVTALALGVMLVGSGDRIMLERPELVSFLLFATLLGLLDRHRRVGDRWVFAIVPLQLLWANLHGLFAVGIAVCGMAVVGECVRPWFERGEPLRRERVRDLVLVIVGSVAVSFANPNGIDAVLMPFEQLGMIGPPGQRSTLGRTIIELRPPLGTEGGFAKLVASCWLAVLAIVLNWRRVLPFDWLLFSALLLLALGAQRNIALLAVASVPIAIRNLNGFVDRHSVPVWARRAFAAGVLGFLSFGIADHVREEGELFSADAVMWHRFPVQAVEWIARERPPGPIYHAMGDGGYLLWHLYPDCRVMVDGRLEVFGPEGFALLSERGGGRPAGFRVLDETHHFGVALLNHFFFPGMHLLAWMEQSPDWRLVWIDDLSAVFVRVGDEPPPWPEVGADCEDLLSPLVDDPKRTRDMPRRFRRISLYQALGDRGRAYALARETCDLYGAWARDYCDALADVKPPRRSLRGLGGKRCD